MMPSTEVAFEVASFWGHNRPASLPYDVIDYATSELEINIITHSNLKVADVTHWMLDRDVASVPPASDRRLYGCLAAIYGVGFIFVDSSASPAEQQFTVAHEVGHFLLDYQKPRLLALERLGSGIMPVLNGEHHPTLVERQNAVLANVQIGTYFTLIERSATGAMSLTTEHAEDRADQFALELLAPAEEVVARMPLALPRFADRLAATTDLLCHSYALPQSIAETYAWHLLSHVGKGPSFFDHLFG